MDRDKALREEVEFWKSRFDRTNPASHRFQRRLMDERRFQPYLEQLVAHLPAGATVHVLDVGSGPLTQVGTISDRWRIKITAVDPLAKEYRKALGFDPRPAVTVLPGEVETLSSMFPKGSFDLVFCRNALDHAVDPLLGIREMLRVVKPDGCVFLTHVTDEGRKQGYQQLHQWDFSPRRDGDLVISKPNGKTMSLRRELRSATVSATMTGVPMWPEDGLPPPSGWHTAVIRPASS